MNDNVGRMDVENTLSPEEREELKKCSAAIDSLAEEIQDRHTPIKLLGKLRLSKSNMIKLAGAMAAGIFTTILRSSVDY